MGQEWPGPNLEHMRGPVAVSIHGMPAIPGLIVMCLPVPTSPNRHVTHSPQSTSPPTPSPQI